MNFSNNLRFNTTIAIVSVLSIYTSPVYAGFEWQAQQPKVETQRQVIIKNYKNETRVLSNKKIHIKEPAPLPQTDIIWNNPKPVTINNVSQDKPVKAKAKKLLITETPTIEERKLTIKKAQKKISGQEMPARIVSKYAVVHGFGKEMPLALALSQIVPADYGYSVQPNVNMGLRITWNGSRSWDIVINEAVAEFGLEAIVLGKSVVLKKIGAPIVEMPKKVIAPQKKRIVKKSKPTDNKQKISEPESREKEDLMQQDQVISASQGEPHSTNPNEIKGKKSLALVSKWKANKDEDLYQLLVQWCNAAGVQLFWNVDEKFTVDEDLMVKGNFEQAVQKLLMSYKGKNTRPVGQLRTNDPKAPAVLEVNLYKK